MSTRRIYDDELHAQFVTFSCYRRRRLLDHARARQVVIGRGMGKPGSRKQINQIHTDYCAMLGQEIQGRKHAFLAGNLVYYVGGRYNWRVKGDRLL